jgi:hypothetical protein
LLDFTVSVLVHSMGLATIAISVWMPLGPLGKGTSCLLTRILDIAWTLGEGTME